MECDQKETDKIVIITAHEWWERFQSGSFQTFGDFTNYLSSCYIVNKADGFWHCTCFNGLKQFVCKHVLFIGHKYYNIPVPDAFDKKRGAGRAKAVSKALCRD